MNDKCPMCKGPFEHGQRGMVIGVVDGKGPRLEFAHVACMLRDVLGPDDPKVKLALDRERITLDEYGQNLAVSKPPKFPRPKRPRPPV